MLYNSNVDLLMSDFYYSLKKVPTSVVFFSGHSITLCKVLCLRYYRDVIPRLVHVYAHFLKLCETGMAACI